MTQDQIVAAFLAFVRWFAPKARRIAWEGALFVAAAVATAIGEFVLAGEARVDPAIAVLVRIAVGRFVAWTAEQRARRGEAAPAV
jgi:hypothetical protein